MSLRHMFPATRAEAQVGDRRVIVEEKEGVAYILVDDEPIEMRCRRRETEPSAAGAGDHTDPPYEPAHTFQLEAAPDTKPEIRTFAMGQILVQWEIPRGFLRVELSPDMTSAEVEIFQHYTA
jgi:hypothetical protein